MSGASPVSPVEIARIALKRLAERGLAPTPENYSQFYNAIVTIKSPESKNTSELQLAWEVLYKVEDLISEANDAAEKLLEVLEGGGVEMETSLNALNDVRCAHKGKRRSVEETHSVLEGLLAQIIESTRNVHTTVTTSQDDLQQIRNSIRNIEQDLSFSRKMMEQDALTGALSRHGLDHLVVREVHRARGNDGKLSAVLMELDDFCQISDRFGHGVGDQALVHVCNLAKAALRDSDMLVRYGEDEFLLLLPETDAAGARYVVERMRQVMVNTPFIYQSQRIELHFSAGIAALKADENGRALVLRADEARDRARHSGRGRIELAQ